MYVHVMLGDVRRVLEDQVRAAYDDALEIMWQCMEIDWDIMHVEEAIDALEITNQV